MTKYKKWPAWCIGPGGEERIIEQQSDLPEGWQTKREAMNPSEPKKRKPKTEVFPVPDIEVDIDKVEATIPELKAALDAAGIAYAAREGKADLARRVMQAVEDGIIDG